MCAGRFPGTSGMNQCLLFFRAGLLPYEKPAPVLVGRIGVKTSRHECEISVTLQISCGGTHEVRGTMREHMGFKPLVAIVSEPHERSGIRFAPIVKSADSHNVPKPVAIEIDFNRTVGSGHISDPMVAKESSTHVFEPLDAVPRAWPGFGIVKSISVREKNVAAPVPVQIGGADTAARASRLQALRRKKLHWQNRTGHP